uniref:Uncharacterized protein n=1 Tax=Seriola lalandi dorsalis TaxID=1841481 RepID=A0A3B4XXU8_SERLL
LKYIDLTNHICGITNGGKPTLTNCCVVHQDDFFNTITNTLDTEIVPKSDHKEKETHICHVEGFLSSTYGPIIEVLNQHYLISISYKDCKKRTYHLYGLESVEAISLIEYDRVLEKKGVLIELLDEDGDGDGCG